MKILLDTSYLLPLIKVEVDDWSSKKLLELLYNQEDKFFFTDISIFEIVAKGMKIALNHENLIPEDIQNGIDSLQNNKDIIRIESFHHPYIYELSFKCRKIHSDFIDCMIFSSAVCHVDCLATYDHTFIEKITQSKEIVDFIETINPEFKIIFDEMKLGPQTFKELNRIPKP